MLAPALSLIGSYFLGSIPFGLLASKCKGVDIRKHGSGNIGATNVWRVCGWRYGLPVFVLDVLKGVAAVWLSRWLAVHFAGDPAWAGIVAAMSCIIGHSFSVWLGFKGGKGVATSLGVFLALMPLPSLIALLLWGIVFKISGYVSLASIVAAFALPAAAIALQFTDWRYGWPVSGFASLVGLLVIVRHGSNIARLRAGTENRFGRKKA
ncbi:MAG: glycerol-3-phosphate 1-O-acyltransferase PlsY [Chthoniobacteraceae bacterium]